MIVHSATLVSLSTSLFIPLSPESIRALDNSIRADLQNLDDSFFRWVLLFVFVVVLGVVLEGPELLHELWPDTFGYSQWVKKIGLIGWMLVVLGVAGEGVFEVLDHRAQGLLQTFNEILLTNAQEEAGGAEDSARVAAADAFRANEAASQAENKTDAVGKEADSFEQEIVSAKEQATKAEEHQAEALRQAAQAQEELDRIKTPRSLSHSPELISALEAFRGTKYVFVSVYQDEESINLLKAIDDVLQKSGWERDKSIGGFPAINVYGKNEPDFSVPVGFDTGIQISVDSPETVENLKSRAVSDLPQYLRAAISLDLNLASNIVPSMKDAVGKVDVEKGASTTIRIAVGSKPLQ